MKRAFIVVGLVLCGLASRAPAQNLLNVYRLFNGSVHLITLNPAEGTSHGYQVEGMAFQTLATPLPGTVSLNRCRIHHSELTFETTDPNCEGQRWQAGLGYIYTTQVAGTTPLYRCFNYGNGDHISTINPSECTAAGYAIEGLQGYAYP